MVDAIIIAVLLGIVFLAIRGIVRERKSGKCSCGCECSSCNLCNVDYSELKSAKTKP